MKRLLLLCLIIFPILLKASTSVTLNGSSYTIPATGDQNWGDNVSNYLIAIPGAVLQKSAGSFSLTADANFGTSFGLVSTYFKSSNGSNIGSTGLLRLLSSEAVVWRNNANSGDNSLGTSSDRLQYNAVNIPTISSTDTLSNKTLAATTMSGNLNMGGNNINTIAALISASSNPAGSGLLKLAGGDTINFKNVALSGDNSLGTASDRLQYNSVNVPTISSTDTLTNKTINGASNTLTVRLANDVTGTLQATNFPALTGDITTSAGSLATTAAATQANIQTLSRAAGVAVHGTNTNDSASAGFVGEYVSSSNSTPANTPANNTWGDATSISLTAGDWDISAVGEFSNNGATVTQYQLGISSTTGNSTTGLSVGDNRVQASSQTNSDTCLTIPEYRVSIASTTTYYLKELAAFSAGQPQIAYRISARRRR